MVTVGKIQRARHRLSSVEDENFAIVAAPCQSTDREGSMLFLDPIPVKREEGGKDPSIKEGLCQPPK
jgi:hypothetical protein